jgi:16S rRNA (guanine527-N7)-methyltransferase
MNLITKYFPGLNPVQMGQFNKLLQIVPELNTRVNIISRKDMEHLEERHVLHSLSIAKKFKFSPDQKILDVGTGGGFPGIPLAIIFPETRFTLVDSIGKKIRLVKEIAATLELKNIQTEQNRMEQLNVKADFVVSRAVAPFSKLYSWSAKLIRSGQECNMPNGLISLKGGDLSSELGPFGKKVKEFPISEWFEEAFFYTKKIVFLKK